MRERACAVFAALVLLTAPSTGGAIAAEPEIVLITNKEVSFDRSLVHSIFGMDIRAWDNDVPVRVFVFPSSSPLHQKFSLTILGVHAYQLERAWNRQLYAGYASRPTVVQTPEEMIERVRTTPGAVGYLDARSVPGNTDIKVIR